MHKKITIISTIFSSILLFSCLTGFNVKKSVSELQIGEYDPIEQAYFAKKIENEVELVKAKKCVVPTDDKYNDQLTRSLSSSLIGDIESVWNEYTGKGRTVAIIDDGFDYNHPEYIRSDGSSAILSTSRYYYCDDYGYRVYYDNYSENPDCIKEDWDSDYDEWATHGTNTSTTAAAPMNNGGGVGIAPDANILALKIDMTFGAIEAAIDYAISQEVDVINMSLGAYAESFYDGFEVYQKGYSGIDTELDSICKKAYNAGIIVVAAAGNEATYHKSYPACNYKVIGVGAIGEYSKKGNANKLAEFTNYVGANQTGEINVDILSPGYVYTATQSGNSKSITHIYDDTQGTSFSSPIVAGAACLWKEKYPNGTPDEFLDQLQSSADDIGNYKDKMVPVSNWDYECEDVGPSNIQNGRLNVKKLLNADDPFLNVRETTLNISIEETRQIHVDSYSGTLSYSSSDNKIASVDNLGKVTGVGQGNTNITVTASKNGKTATKTVSVNVAPITAATSVSFNPKEITLNVGETYNSEESIIITPNNASRVFMFASNDDSVVTVDEELGIVTAIKEGTTTIEVVPLYGTGYDTLTVKVNNLVTFDGLITFGSEGDALINSSSVTVKDDLDNEWSIVTKGTASFTQNKNNSQIGSSNNPASEVSFVMNVGTNVTFTDVIFSVGGNSGSAGNISIKVDSNEIGTGNISSSTDTDVINEKTATGTTLNILISDIKKGIKIYSISYSYMSSGVKPVVTDVSLSPTSLSLDVFSNPTGTLVAKVNGTDLFDTSVIYSSNNEQVATVNENGVVTAIKEGSAIITATSHYDKTKSATCSVTVTDSTPVSLTKIEISGYKTSLEVNTEFIFGGTVKAYFSDNTNKDVTSSATFSGYNMSTPGKYTVTVTYTFSAVSKNATYTLTVKPSGVISSNFTIAWGTLEDSETCKNFNATSGSINNLLSFKCTKNSSQNDPAYNDNSHELRLYYGGSSGNGNSITITPLEDLKITAFTIKSSTNPTVKYYVDEGDAVSTSYTTQDQKYYYSANNFEAKSSLTIQNRNTTNTQFRILYIELTFESTIPADKIVNSLSATYSGSSVFIGDNLDTSKVSVVASYTDKSKYQDEKLDAKDYAISGFSSEIAGKKVVTVTYIGKLNTTSTPLTTTFEVEVISDTVADVKITCSKSYHPGDTILKNDLTVTLIYKSGKQSVTTDYIFNNDNYMFTYADAPSGGNIGSKQLSITFNDKSYNFNVNVSRTNYQSISSKTVSLSGNNFKEASGLSQSSGTPSNSNIKINNIDFTVTTNAYCYNKNKTYYISFGKNEGSINNTNAFESDLTEIKITELSGSRNDGVLYISKDGVTYEEYDEYSVSTLNNGGYRYFKFAYTSSSSASGALGYSNIQSIEYKLSGQDNPINVSNYIMYEDTNNQCITKLDIQLID